MNPFFSEIFGMKLSCGKILKIICELVVAYRRRDGRQYSRA